MVTASNPAQRAPQRPLGAGHAASEYREGRGVQDQQAVVEVHVRRGVAAGDVAGHLEHQPRRGEVDRVIAVEVNHPSLTVYRKGYVAWNNQYIFPDRKRRLDFKWSNDYVFRLEKFRPEYKL